MAESNLQRFAGASPAEVILEEKWFAKKSGFKQLKISIFAYQPTRKLAYFKYKNRAGKLLRHLADRSVADPYIWHKKQSTMNLPKQLANQFREVHLNGTWVVATNLKTQLSDLGWKQATAKVGNLNTIAALAFHINYYVAGLVQVFEGGSLDIRDRYSFDMPPIESQADWETLLDKMWSDAEKFATLVEQMPEEKLWAVFTDEKYGNYFRNIHGLIEHSYYHLGQIVLIKKLLGPEPGNGF